VRVDRLGPRIGRPGSLLARLFFNLALPLRLSADAYDLVVGFDLDGCLFRADVPRIASLKGVMADEMRFERGATRLRFRVLSRLERLAARTADRVVVTSEHSREAVRREYGVPEARLRVVPEGIHLEAWRHARRAAREGPGVERRREDPPPRGNTGGGPGGEGPTLLSVARQYPRKNTEDLLRALPAVREAVPGTRLRIVGDGPERGRLESLRARLDLGRSVRFLGAVRDRARLRAEYFSADLFCLPTLQEGFGIVFLEAMAAGLPVVACDAAAVPEVVRDGETGVLVPPRDVDALARAVVSLLRDPDGRSRMGARGRRIVERYDWPRVARRFLEAVDLAEAGA